MQRVVVIGAGVAGLATSALLARQGFEVSVVDSQPTVGGRAGVHEEQGFRWDTGPSWYLMPEAFEQFFRLCGTSVDQELTLIDLDPAYRIVDPQGTCVDVRSGREQVIQLFESLEPGSAKAIDAYLSNASEIYQLSLEHFLYTTFASLKNFFHPVLLTRCVELTTLLCKSLESYVDARFRHPVLRQVLQYPAVFLSTQPAKAPALYSLMSHTDLVEGVRYPQGGFAAVVEAIADQARKAGVQFHLNTKVTRILTEQNQATGVATTKGVLPADIVVSAADLHHTETALLDERLQTYPAKKWKRRDPGIGAVVVLLGVQGALPQLCHHTLLFNNPWDTDFDTVFPQKAPQSQAYGSHFLPRSSSLYVSKTSATDPTAAPAGHENLFLLIPVPTDQLGRGDLFTTDTDARVQAIADAAIQQIAQWADIPDLEQRIVVKRTIGPGDYEQEYHAWRGGAIGLAHTLQQSAFLRGRNRSKKVENLFYAGGTTVPGVGVPMCLISAENVVKALADDTTSHALRELPMAPHKGTQFPN